MTDIPTDKQLDELDQAILDCMPNKQTGLYDVLTFRARVHGYVAKAVLAELKALDKRWDEILDEPASIDDYLKERIAAIEKELSDVK